MLRTEKLISLHESDILDADLSADLRLALLVRDENDVSLVVDDWKRRVWRLSEARCLWRARWIFNNRVAIWGVPNGTSEDAVLACSSTENMPLLIGWPHHIVGGRKISYASYGEVSYLDANKDALASNMVISFDCLGRKTCGLEELLDAFSWPSGGPIEISACCITNDDKLLINFYPSPGLWLMDPIKNDLQLIPGSDDIDGVMAIAEDHGQSLILYSEDKVLRIVQFDLQRGCIVGETDINKDQLCKPRPFKGQISAHGCPNGNLLISACNSIFRVYLAREI